MLPDGIIILVRMEGKQIFAGGVPLPRDYEHGKLLLASLASDALVAWIQERDRRTIKRLEAKLSEKEKGE